MTCHKFVTSTEYIPGLQRRLQTETELITDAQTCGWPREVERHTCTQRRIQSLLAEHTDSSRARDYLRQALGSS